MTSTTIKTFDIVVVGAGSAGFSAAIAAAKTGLKVCLIEKNQYSGGLATSAMVGTVCGLYLTGTSLNPQWAVGGFVKQFAEELGAESNSKATQFFESLFFLPYKIEVFKSLCEKYLKDFGVEVLHGAEVLKVNYLEDTIQTLEISQKGKTFLIKAQNFIDCSGTALLSLLCNKNWVEGGVNQAAARVFSLSGIEDMPSEAIHFSVSRVIQRGLSNGSLSADCASLSVVPGSYFNGSASFKLGLPEVVTNSPEQRKQILDHSTQLVIQTIEFLKENSQPFANAILAEIAPEVGFRTSFRSVGEDCLSEQQVLEEQKIKDGIANGSWPIEYWKPGAKVEIQHLNDGGYYQISAGCLESKYLKNLYFAGRNLSADILAMASARVMGTCLQTGFAAGILASFATIGKSRTQAILEIQNSLELNK